MVGKWSSGRLFGDLHILFCDLGGIGMFELFQCIVYGRKRGKKRLTAAQPREKRGGVALVLGKRGRGALLRSEMVSKTFWQGRGGEKNYRRVKKRGKKFWMSGREEEIASRGSHELKLLFASFRVTK